MRLSKSEISILILNLKREGYELKYSESSKIKTVRIFERNNKKVIITNQPNGWVKIDKE